MLSGSTIAALIWGFCAALNFAYIWYVDNDDIDVTDLLPYFILLVLLAPFGFIFCCIDYYGELEKRFKNRTLFERKGGKRVWVNKDKG